MFAEATKGAKVDEWQDALSPRQFEELVAALLREEGYQSVRVVGQTGDKGVDITCVDGDGRLVVVQCKKYKSTSTVGAPEIRTFFGVVVAQRAARGIYATTGRFTQPAVRHAQQNDIELIDGARLARYYKARRSTQSNPTQSIETPASGKFIEANFLSFWVWGILILGTLICMLVLV